MPRERSGLFRGAESSIGKAAASLFELVLSRAGVKRPRAKGLRGTRGRFGVDGALPPAGPRAPPAPPTGPAAATGFPGQVCAAIRRAVSPPRAWRFHGPAAMASAARSAWTTQRLTEIPRNELPARWSPGMVPQTRARAARRSSWPGGYWAMPSS